MKSSETNCATLPGEVPESGERPERSPKTCRLRLWTLDLPGLSGLRATAARATPCLRPSNRPERACRPSREPRWPQRSWIESATPEPLHVGRVEQEPPALDECEKEAIALALQLDTLVVLEDLNARRRARPLGMELTGTLGILLRLHRSGLARGELASDLTKLQEADMYFSEDIRNAILEAKDS